MRDDMKALVKAKPEPGLILQHEPVPEIGPDEILDFALMGVPVLNPWQSGSRV
jgi:hypothetical protein